MIKFNKYLIIRYGNYLYLCCIKLKNMEKEYLTAEEARKLSDEFNKFNVNGLKNILEDIKSLSLIGKTELITPYVYGLCEALDELGYDVERYGGWGDEYLEIKW